MIPKPVYGRNGLWAYTMCGDTWVTHVTHLPTMTTHEAGMSYDRVRKLAAMDALLATVVNPDDLCKACSKPYIEYRTHHFCRACLAVAPNYKEGSL